MKFFLTYFTIILLSNFSLAQYEDSKWLFGFNEMDNFAYKDSMKYKNYFDFIEKWPGTWGASSIDFSIDPPIIKYEKDIVMDFFECNSSITNQRGDLLLYTNGMNVCDGNNKLFVDSMNFNGFYKSFSQEVDGIWYALGNPLPQGSLILPVPKDTNLFYILYEEVEFSAITYPSIKYALVQLDNEKHGHLIFKDRTLINGQLNIGMTACKHGNGQDWWIVFTDTDKTIYKYLLSKEGLHFVNAQKFEIDLYTYNGGFYFSPQGDVLAWHITSEAAMYPSYLYLFNFDRCSGDLSLYYSEHLDEFPQNFIGGLAFSPDNKYLYLNKSEIIHQYEFHHIDPLSSKTIVAESDGYNYIYPEWPTSKVPVLFGQMAIAPDGKIYISCWSGGNRKMSVINRPNKFGLASEVKQHSIHITTAYARTMPNFPNYRLGPLDGSTCDTLGLDNHPIAKYRYESDSSKYRNLEFFDLSYFRPNSWAWDFGDGFTSDKQEPRHEFKENGSYNVCLTVSNENSSNTTCRLITIGPSAIDHELTMDKVVSIFPNPTDGYLLMTISEYIPEHGEVFIYDMQGRLVLKQNIYYGWNNIDMTTLSQGTYLYKVTDKKTKIGEGKIVKI